MSVATSASGPRAGELGFERAAQLARSGRDDDLRALILGGAVASDAVDAKGDGLVMLAAYHGHAQTVAMLAELGAPIDARNGRGLTPVDGAAFKGDLAVLEALHAAGAPIDAPGPDGRAPLAWAAAFDRAAAVEWLLAHGANPAHRDAEGLTAADHARALGAVRAAQRLATVG